MISDYTIPSQDSHFLEVVSCTQETPLCARELVHYTHPRLSRSTYIGTVNMYIVTRLYFPDYTGQFCELNVNRCSMLSCFEGVNCSDNRGRSRATCGPCPTGLTGDGLQCTGIESHHCNYITLRFYIDVDPSLAIRRALIQLVVSCVLVMEDTDFKKMACLVKVLCSLKSHSMTKCSH